MQSGSETILVVEDDELVRTSVITQLQSLGYQTISAASGDEALAIVESGAAFDLLFTDVILSKSMNGRQLAIEIERRRPGTKVCSRRATPRTPSSITAGSIPACCCSPSPIGKPSWRG